MSSTIVTQTGSRLMAMVIFYILTMVRLLRNRLYSALASLMLIIVLFYFATSPFFDPQSSNGSIFQQAMSDHRFLPWVGNRQIFEQQLQRLSGLEYVVAFDPRIMNVQIDGPNGKEISNVWVIRKQKRQKRAGHEDQVTVLAFYYIVGDVIYQAPSVGRILTNRLVCVLVQRKEIFLC